MKAEAADYCTAPSGLPARLQTLRVCCLTCLAALAMPPPAAVDRETYRRALRARRASIWLINCRVLDTHAGKYQEKKNILIVGDKIETVTNDQPDVQSGQKVVDCKGWHILPGKLMQSCQICPKLRLSAGPYLIRYLNPNICRSL